MERFIRPPGPVPPKTVPRGTVAQTLKRQGTYNQNLIWFYKCDGKQRGKAEMSNSKDTLRQHTKSMSANQEFLSKINLPS